MNPPKVLLDPAGEGVYILDDPWIPKSDFSLLEVALMLELFDGHGRPDWRAVDFPTVWMRPTDDDEWKPVSTGRVPRGWRLLLPRRWRPVAYAYCTPKPPDHERQP